MRRRTDGRLTGWPVDGELAEGFEPVAAAPEGPLEEVATWIEGAGAASVAQPGDSLALSGQCVHFHSSERMGELEDGVVDLIVTSPPYWNHPYGPADGDLGRFGREKEDYLAGLERVWRECYRVARAGAVLVLVMNGRYQVSAERFHAVHYEMLNRMAGWTLWEVHTRYVPGWSREEESFEALQLDALEPRFDPVFVFRKGSDPITFHPIRVEGPDGTVDRLGNVIKSGWPGGRTWGFSAGLAGLYQTLYSREGDRVLDPFLGLGPTLRAASCLGRRGVGYEVQCAFWGVLHEQLTRSFTMPAIETFLPADARPHSGGGA